MCYLFHRGTKQYVTAVIKGLVSFFLVFLFLQWDGLGEPLSWALPLSILPTIFTYLNSHYVAARVGLSYIFSSKKQCKEIQCLAGDHKGSQFPDHFNALRNSEENMFGSVEKQVSGLPFQYKQCTKEKKESINEMLLMEARCIIPMGLDRLVCCTEWCMQQGIKPIIIIIYPQVFSCIGEGRSKPAVISNVLKWPSAL